MVQWLIFILFYLNTTTFLFVLFCFDYKQEEVSKWYLQFSCGYLKKRSILFYSIL